MVAQLFMSRGFLLAGSLVILVLSALLVGGQFLETLRSGAGRAETIVDQEETLSLLFIALGAILQGRASMVSWLVRTGRADEEREEDLSGICDYYGFFILQVGMFVEILDQASDYIDAFPRVVVALEFLINYPLNFWAIALLATVSYRLAVLRRA